MQYITVLASRAQPFMLQPCGDDDDDGVWRRAHTRRTASLLFMAICRLIEGADTSVTGLIIHNTVWEDGHTVCREIKMSPVRK